MFVGFSSIKQIILYGCIYDVNVNRNILFITLLIFVCYNMFLFFFFFFIILTRGKRSTKDFFVNIVLLLKDWQNIKKIKIKKIQFLVYLFDIYKIIIQVTQMRKMFKKLSHNFRLTIKTDFFLSRFNICFVLYDRQI